MDKPTIKLAQLQKDYPGKIIALNKQETKIIATAASFSALINKLQKAQIDPQDCIYIGPIPKHGTASV